MKGINENKLTFLALMLLTVGMLMMGCETLDMVLAPERAPSLDEAITTTGTVFAPFTGGQSMVAGGAVLAAMDLFRRLRRLTIAIREMHATPGAVPEDLVLTPASAKAVRRALVNRNVTVEEPANLTSTGGVGPSA